MVSNELLSRKSGRGQTGWSKKVDKALPSLISKPQEILNQRH